MPLRLATLALALLTPLISRAESAIEYECLGNHVETCFVVVDGPIEPGLTARLQELFPEGIEAQRLYVNSPGGNLGEAVKLGRYVRTTGLTTMIGAKRPARFNEDGTKQFMGGDFPVGGICESACIYVFIGGLERHLSEGQTLGLHRFHANAGNIDGVSAQAISGELVSYMVEMGVDARVFKRASRTDKDQMYRLTQEEALEYDLITPIGYGDFFMEPYKQGVVASSKRLEPTNGYDLAHQITFYCRRGQAYALITADGLNLEDISEAPLVVVKVDGNDFRENQTAVVRSTEEADLITVPLSRATQKGLKRASIAYLAASYSRASGDARKVELDLSDMDRSMIASAFTHCID